MTMACMRKKLTQSSMLGSVPCGRCYPRRSTNRHDGNTRTGSAANGKAQGYSQETSFCRGSRFRFCYLLRQNRYAPFSSVERLSDIMSY